MGENTIVPLDDFNDPFWIMLVTKCVHVLQESMLDGWNKQSKTRDVIIYGYWYVRFQQGSRTYTLRNDKPIAYVFSHLVLDSKFTMLPIGHTTQGRSHTFELSHEALNIILNALEQIRLLDARAE
jgi:hypothetical protein